MTTRRETVLGLLGAGVAAGVPAGAAFAAGTARAGHAPVRPARLYRPPAGGTTFVPLGEARTLPMDYDYVEEEWFAGGTDDLGQPYVTALTVRRPRDKAKFSGVLVVEPQHMAGVAPIYMYSSRYILRSGHAWVCVTSQKTSLEAHQKKADPARYASLQIAGTPGPMPAGLKRWEQLQRSEQASNAILAQVGAALRAGMGPLAGFAPRKMVMVGHSQTGFVSTFYITTSHETHRLAGGAPVYDGYMPTGFPTAPFGPRDVPLIQVLSEGDIPLPRPPAVFPDFPNRAYRRPDSDAPNDRYRLYELAGFPHMGTRNPPNSDPRPWMTRNPGVIMPDSVMNSLPHNEMFNMALDHLVQWVDKGKAPPRAERIATDADGNFLKDEHGNSRGGLRCVELDVPHARSIANPPNPDGSLLIGTFGFEVPFGPEKMKALYGTPTNYVVKFNQRLAELIQQGWVLGADATTMRDEALSQSF
jgi:hypothetical protein